jgi:hypothetical protein
LQVLHVEQRVGGAVCGGGLHRMFQHRHARA